MNRVDELREMDRDTLNKTVAIALGWTAIKTTGEYYKQTAQKLAMMSNLLCGTTPNGTKGRILPDFSRDLNAVHSAWCTLSEEEHRIFREILSIIVVQDGHIFGPCRSLSNAIAKQRAIALVLTKETVK